jgi:hypothetical protein
MPPAPVEAGSASQTAYAPPWQKRLPILSGRQSFFWGSRPAPGAGFPRMDLWLRLRFTLLSRHRWRHSSHAELRDENFAGLCPLWYILFGTSYICPPPLGGSTSEFPRRFPTAGSRGLLGASLAPASNALRNPASRPAHSCRAGAPSGFDASLSVHRIEYQVLGPAQAGSGVAQTKARSTGRCAPSK